MQESELLGILSTSIPEFDEILRGIREKYHIPPVLPENMQLAETLRVERSDDEWKVIRDEIEAELRIKIPVLPPGVEAGFRGLFEFIRSSVQWKNPEDATVKTVEPELEKLSAVIQRDIASGLEFVDRVYRGVANRLFDYLLTGRPIEVPKEWINIVLATNVPPSGEKIVVAVAHQGSNPDELCAKFREQIIQEFGEKPAIKPEYLETAEYLAMKNTGKHRGEIVDIYLERHPEAIGYALGTKEYRDAREKLAGTLKVRIYRLQQTVNEILGYKK